MGSKTTYRMINRKHFGYREGDDEVGLQHTTTPDVIASFWQYKRLFPHLPVYPVDMSFYRHIMTVGGCGGELVNHSNAAQLLTLNSQLSTQFGFFVFRIL